MLENNIVENVSRHRGYVETGPSVWIRPQSKRVTIGEENLGYVKSPVNRNAIKVFDIEDFQKAQKKFNNKEISAFERSMAGWSSEFQPKWQSVIEEEYKAEKEGRQVAFAGLIEPTQFATLKTTQRVVQVFTTIEEQHAILDTIRVINVDDLNGIAIYDLNSIDTDPIQPSGTHTIPYEVTAPDFVKSVMEPRKYAWRVSFSDEMALVNFDLPDLEQLVLAQITGKLDTRRNNDVAAIINAVGNSGTQANWKTLNTGETRYLNSAYEDVKELLTLISQQKYGNAEFFGMHPDVWDAFIQNANATVPTGLQPFVQRPFNYDNGFRETNSLFPGIRFVIDSLLTTNRIYAWRRDSIFQVFGGVRAVPFENREIGYRGTTFRTYFNTSKIKAALIKGGQGVIS